MDADAAALVRTMQAGAQPMPADTGAWLAQYRAQLDGLTRFQGPAPDIVVQEAAGARIYRPPGPAPRPTLLFMHGGGFVAGTLRAYDVPLRSLALRSGWQVMAVDYRLAPEHPYPAAPEDGWAALRFLAGGGAEADAARLAVGGDSAGGLLATVLARRARAAGIPLRFQALLYPNTDLRPGPHHASRTEYDGVVIRMDELYRSLDLYMSGADRTAADASPLLSPDLAGLCPAWLVTNEIDPLRDEAEAYGQRLRDAGVSVRQEREAGMVHGALQYGAVVAAGDRLITRFADALRYLP